MVNIFPISSNDQSIYYLSQIFGLMGGALPSAPASMVLGVMFRVFNTVILSVAVLVVLYVTIVGVMKTAHEGEAMKGWQSLWVPIRLVLGIAALIPNATGYCAIQIVFMWVIVQGIGAADALWNSVLQYTEIAGSPTAPIGVSDGAAVSSDFDTLWQALVCQQSAAFSQGEMFNRYDGTFDGSYYCSNKLFSFTKFCRSAQSNNLTNITTGPQAIDLSKVLPGVNTNGGPIIYTMGPFGSCGRMLVCNPDYTCQDTSTVTKQMGCAACRAQVQLLQSTVTTFSSLAQQFVQADFDYRLYAMQSVLASGNATQPSWLPNFCTALGLEGNQCCFPSITSLVQNNSPCKLALQFAPGGDANNSSLASVSQVLFPYVIQPLTGNKDFIDIAAQNYIQGMADAISPFINQIPINNKIYAEASSLGWIFAGAYYYELAKESNKNQNAIPSLNINGTDPGPDDSNFMHNFHNNYDVAGLMSSEINFSTTDSYNMKLPRKVKSLSKLTKSLKAGSGDIMDTFIKWMTGGDNVTNPVPKLQHFGFILLIMAQVVFGVALAVIIPLTMLGYFDVFVLGTGVTNFVGPLVTTLSIIFAPLFTLLLGALFIFGASLAIYVPLIPYIIFTMGAIAWFILVIEAMIAAPLVALGIMSPSGHDLLGKSEHALMLLFNIFLRPSLMIFGMIASMLLVIVVVTMINTGFTGVMASIYDRPGPLELILFLCAYVALILAALNKCFALIHIIPDRTIRWIGGHPGGEGAEAAGEAVSGVSKAVEGGAGQARGAGAGAMGRGKAAGEAFKGLKGTQEKKYQEAKGKAGGQAAPSAKPADEGEKGGNEGEKGP